MNAFKVCVQCVSNLDYCVSFVDRCRRIESLLRRGLDVDYVASEVDYRYICPEFVSKLYFYFRKGTPTFSPPPTQARKVRGRRILTFQPSLVPSLAKPQVYKSNSRKWMRGEVK